ncbi:hypothetical protein HLH33_09910 [Gluconacetobacter diazotrophicus]|uniref:Type 4 secretion system PilS N-terminal domain-containing protein n=1 Tax=Gluconacetobacter diazotrophicus TaxID=33996 RepID=A0A7W4I552_GLUDI|nr:type 4 pilus major pilin [Gluconacetobacter diazotrophicus]MBB2156619.1 hypothetical protein [Gluconacetobacter diazotrophicus]
MERIAGVLIAALLGALALGYVSLKGAAGYSGTYLNAAISDATEIANNAKADLGSNGVGAADYSGLDNQTAISGKMIPDGMVSNGSSTITGPWPGSTVTVSGSGSTITEAWTGVDAASCTQFAESQKTIDVAVNGTTVAIGAGTSGAALSITSACQAGSQQTSTITFTYQG